MLRKRRVKDEPPETPKGIERPPLRFTPANITSNVALPDTLTSSKEHVFRDSRVFNAGSFSIANFTSAVHALSSGSSNKARSETSDSQQVVQLSRIPSADETVRKYWPVPRQQSDSIMPTHHMESHTLSNHGSVCSGHHLPPAWFTPTSFNTSVSLPESSDMVRDSRIFSSGFFNAENFAASIHAISSSSRTTLRTEPDPRTAPQPALYTTLRTEPDPRTALQPALYTTLRPPAQYVRADTSALEVEELMKLVPQLPVDPPVSSAPFNPEAEIIGPLPKPKKKPPACW